MSTGVPVTLAARLPEFTWDRIAPLGEKAGSTRTARWTCPWAHRSIRCRT